MANKRTIGKRGIAEGDSLPNALAALARTRERSVAEIDELLANRSHPDSPSQDAPQSETPGPFR